MARRAIEDRDRADVAAFIERHWYGRSIVNGGHVYHPHEHEGFIERRDDQIVGLLTMRQEADAMHVLTLNSTVGGQRIGTSLMLMAIEEARRRGCVRVGLVSTNENVRALGLYQRLGFRIVRVDAGAVDQARKIKPEIPECGANGIPIHDELIMELRLEPYL